MKRHIHFSLSGAVLVWGVWKELWQEIPGTGQSIMQLMRAGWGRFEIAQYFPWTWVNVAMLVVGVGWAGLAFKRSSGRRESGA